MAGDADADPRVGHDPAADVGHGPDRGLQVQSFALLVATAAHQALRLQGVDQVADAPGDRPVPGQDRVHVGRVTATLAALDHGGPVRAVELGVIVPLLVVIRVGDRLLALPGVERDAVVLVGEELGGADPDLLGVVARGLDIDLVGEFHGRDGATDLARDGRQIVGAAGEEAVLVEVPAVAVVVPVGHRPLFEGAQVRQVIVGEHAVVKGHASVPTDPVVPGAGGECGAEVGGGLVDHR